MQNPYKVVIFDLDETIGHFEEISLFLNGLKNFCGPSLDDNYVTKLLDIWPVFFRPGIFNILNMIKRIKKQDNLVKVVIYTNNMGPRKWTLLIKNYLERKINYKIFDKIITGFRPYSKQNCRTTHEKTYSDLLRCTKYGKTAEFVFLDDQYHPKMFHPKIKYVYLHPYNFGLPFEKMAEMFIKSSQKIVTTDDEKGVFKELLVDFLSSTHDGHKYVIARSEILSRDIQEYYAIKKVIKSFLEG